MIGKHNRDKTPHYPSSHEVDGNRNEAPKKPDVLREDRVRGVQVRVPLRGEAIPNLHSLTLNLKLNSE